jgi:hypothetical protein
MVQFTDTGVPEFCMPVAYLSGCVTFVAEQSLNSYHQSVKRRISYWEDKHKVSLTLRSLPAIRSAKSHKLGRMGVV